jgi:hypothetical protein
MNCAKELDRIRHSKPNTKEIRELFAAMEAVRDELAKREMTSLYDL